jgi:hypothetical protein
VLLFTYISVYLNIEYLVANTFSLAFWRHCSTVFLPPMLLLDPTTFWLVILYIWKWYLSLKVFSLFSLSLVFWKFTNMCLELASFYIRYTGRQWVFSVVLICFTGNLPWIYLLWYNFPLFFKWSFFFWNFCDFNVGLQRLTFQFSYLSLSTAIDGLNELINM